MHGFGFPPAALLCLLALRTAHPAIVAQWTWSGPQCFASASTPGTSCWTTAQAGYQSCFTATNGATSSILFPAACAATQCKCWWSTTAPGNFVVIQTSQAYVFPQDGVRLCASTVGFTGLTLTSSSLWRTAAGPPTAILAYSTDAGSSWTTVSTYTLPTATAPFSLTLPVGAEGSPSFCVGFGAAVAYTGQLKWGDMVLSGTAGPAVLVEKTVLLSGIPYSCPPLLAPSCVAVLRVAGGGGGHGKNGVVLGGEGACLTAVVNLTAQAPTLSASAGGRGANSVSVYSSGGGGAGSAVLGSDGGLIAVAGGGGGGGVPNDLTAIGGNGGAPGAAAGNGISADTANTACAGGGATQSAPGAFCVGGGPADTAPGVAGLPIAGKASAAFPGVGGGGVWGADCLSGTVNAGGSGGSSAYNASGGRGLTCVNPSAKGCSSGGGGGGFYGGASGASSNANYGGGGGGGSSFVNATRAALGEACAFTAPGAAGNVTVVAVLSALFTAPSAAPFSWVVPAGCGVVQAALLGGGGGGGYAAGGLGGSGALLTVNVSVIPGAALMVWVGGGGAGSPASAANPNGGSGGGASAIAPAGSPASPHAVAAGGGGGATTGASATAGCAGGVGGARGQWAGPLLPVAQPQGARRPVREARPTPRALTWQWAAWALGTMGVWGPTTPPPLRWGAA